MLREVANFLNHPEVKETVKNGAGSLTFAVGAWSGLDLVCSKKKETPFNKMVKVSLVVSALASRPGIFILSRVFGLCGSWERLCGPNTIYAVNPCHPRHVISFVAALLTIPALWTTNRWLCLAAFFNFLTSRPVLHIGNYYRNV